MLECYKEELQRTIERWRKLKDVRLAFLYATDMHIDFEENRPGVERQMEAMVELAKETEIDCIVLGGDIIHGIYSKESCISELEKFVKQFSKVKVPTYVVRGNHDDNAYHMDPWIPPYDTKRVPHKYVIWDYEWTKTILEPLAQGNAVHDEENPLSSYYYVDFPGKKIRAIFMDAYACPDEKNGELAVWVSEGWDRISERQLQWLADEALDTTKEDWEYLLFSHGPFIPGCVVPPCGNASILCDILEAFQHQTRYTNETLGINADYTNAKSKMHYHIFGHTHTDGYQYDEKTGVCMINTGQCSFGEIDCSRATFTSCVSPKRERDTITEALFDMFVLCEDGMLHRIRFGAGEDQEFQMK